MREDRHSFRGRNLIRAWDAERDVHGWRKVCIDLVDDGCDRVLGSIEERIEYEICHVDSGQGRGSWCIGRRFRFGFRRGNRGGERVLAISS